MRTTFPKSAPYTAERPAKHNSKVKTYLLILAKLLQFFGNIEILYEAKTLDIQIIALNL